MKKILNGATFSPIFSRPTLLTLSILIPFGGSYSAQLQKMAKYLIGKFIDPFFGLGTGILAYYIWETDPKNSHLRPEGQRLHQLVQKKYLNSTPLAPNSSSS